MLDNEWICRLLDLMLGKKSPHNNYGEKKHVIGNKFSKVEWESVIILVN